MKNSAKRLSIVLKEIGVDAFITYNPKNTRYICDMKAVSRVDGHAVVSTVGMDMLTGFANKEQAIAECNGCDNIIITNSSYTICDYLKEKGFKKIAFEETFLTVKEYEELCDGAPDIKFVHGNDILNEIKQIKTEDEIELIRKACEMTDDIFASILKIIKPGITELEINKHIHDKVVELGAEGCTFEPLIVSGKRSSMPHGVPTLKKLENGDFLTIDMGVVCEGYESDFTRTVVIGKASDKQKEIYNIVKTAQQTAVDKIMPGMTGREGDKMARDIIDAAGYGVNFGHSLGHGMNDGMRLVNSPIGDFVLKENMIFTIEPGIYIENFGGVRIEDMVLLTADGCVSFYKTGKELIEI